LRVVAPTAKTPAGLDYFGCREGLNKLMVKPPLSFGHGGVFIRVFESEWHEVGGRRLYPTCRLKRKRAACCPQDGSK
jgi:hypothetical protein